MNDLLFREKDVAKLNDIYIYDHSRCFFEYLTFFKVGKNFRNKGVGSMLLKYVISHCVANNIKIIEGRISGDLVKLVPWCKKHGFDVDEDNNISMRLSVR